MAPLVGRDLLQDGADRGVFAALRELRDHAGRHAFVQRAVDEGVDRERGEGQRAVLREGLGASRLGERGGAHGLPVEASREGVAELGVANLVERVPVRRGDQRGGRAEAHQVEREPRERGDRRVFGAPILAPLRGDPGSFGRVDLGRHLDRGPASVRLEPREHHAAEAPELPAT